MLLRTHQHPQKQGIPTLLVLMLLITQCGLAVAQLSAARVMSISGTAKAIDPQGLERALEKGGEVRSGDKVVTSEGALVQL